MNDDDLLLCPPTTPLTVAERDRIESTLRDRLRIQTAVERRAAGRRARAAAAFLPALVVTCLGSGLALVLVAVASPSSTPLDRHPVAASGPAVRTLEVAARRVEGAATVAPGPGQFVYVRSIATTNDGRLGDAVQLGPRHPREVWLSQEPRATQVQGLVREFGQDWPLRGSAGSPAGIRRPTYAYLASLPRDPVELLDELVAQLPPWDDARSEDQVLFDSIVDLVSEGLAPPGTTAALYRALTRIPGVVRDDHAHDLLGRPGTAITRTENTFADRTAIIIDPSSGETIGVRYLMSTPSGDVLFGATALVAHGISDAAGQVPGRLTPVDTGAGA